MTYDSQFGYNLDENVLDLIEKAELKFTPSPRYQSRHREQTRQEILRAKSSHKTLGEPRVKLRPPSDYLKKHTRITPERPVINHVHYHRPDYIHHLPEWTPTKAKQITEQQRNVPDLPRDPVTFSRVDFRKRNIEIAKNLQVKPVKPRSVHTRCGDTQDLLANGLVPFYVYKKDFGQLPKHLKNNKYIPLAKKHYKSLKDDKIKVDEDTNQQDLSQTGCKYIKENKKAALLQQMKIKWAELIKEFQCLPFVIDTASKIRRKIELEAMLKQLDKDIDLIERHPYIFVYQDYSKPHALKHFH